MTWAGVVPPLGFTNSPSILCSKNKNRLLPVTSTCGLSITFSLGMVVYVDFKDRINTAVLNAFEFGQV